MVEVIYVGDRPLEEEPKRALVEKATRIFDEELGTPPPRLRVIFQHVAPENSKLGLVDGPGR